MYLNYIKLASFILYNRDPSRFDMCVYLNFYYTYLAVWKKKGKDKLSNDR